MLAGIVIAIALAGCRGHPQFKAPPKTHQPLSYVQTTPYATVRLTLAPSVGALPGLRFKLYQDGVRELTNFVVQAQGDHLHLAQKGISDPPYKRFIDWTVTAATPRLAGAEQTWFDDTGGVHPNHGAKGLIWDTLGDIQIPRTDLFKSDVDPALLDQTLCNAVKVARARRMGPQAAAVLGASWPCPKWAETELTLAPSTIKGKIGGLTFLFDPYVLGAYADGGYAVTVPVSAFHFWLSPTWASEFAGDPAPPPPAPLAPKR